jgi:hypothetical protein
MRTKIGYPELLKKFAFRSARQNSYQNEFCNLLRAYYYYRYAEEKESLVGLAQDHYSIFDTIYSMPHNRDFCGGPKNKATTVLPTCTITYEAKCFQSVMLPYPIYLYKERVWMSGSPRPCEAMLIVVVRKIPANANHRGARRTSKIAVTRSVV